MYIYVHTYLGNVSYERSQSHRLWPPVQTFNIIRKPRSDKGIVVYVLDMYYVTRQCLGGSLWRRGSFFEILESVGGSLNGGSLHQKGGFGTRVS